MPFHPDACGHGGYLFSFECQEINPNTQEKYPAEKIDVYRFDSLSQGFGPEYCLRFGPKGHEYYSPGCLKHILSSAAQCLERYRLCAEGLQERGLMPGKISHPKPISTGAAPVTLLHGELVEWDGDWPNRKAIVWLEIAPGTRVRTSIPAEKLEGVPLRHFEFLWELETELARPYVETSEQRSERTRIQVACDQLLAEYERLNHDQTPSS